jgi:SAM-dependent methyltransferase
VVDGIPVLINEQSSLFSIDDFVSHHRTFFANVGETPRKRIVPRLKPTIGKNIKGKSNFDRMADVLFTQSRSPRVLVIGGSILGQGMESLAGNGGVELVETDVAFGARTMLICDAHDIPFEDETFDGVVAQAVLEHVVDPYRCCEEIHRVLKDRGVVYAETPFMQQVHSRYDFTRFTRLGHRRLFRRFEEIDSGAVGGPGMALAWSYKYFLTSGTGSRTLKRLIQLFASLTSFYLKYFDYYLIDKPSALDAASGYYFMGRKAERVLSDRELMKLYKGSR